jgi:hypothetical protein
MDERAALLGRRLAALHQKQDQDQREYLGHAAAVAVKEASELYHPSGTAPLRQHLDNLIRISKGRAREWPQFGVIHGDLIFSDTAISAIEHGSGMGWRCLDLAAAQHACERALGGAHAPIWRTVTISYCAAWPDGEAILMDLPFGQAWLAVRQAKSVLDSPERNPATYQENIMRSLGESLREMLSNY